MNVRTDGFDDLWLYDLLRETLSPLTSDEARDTYPIWNPDGTHVTFASDRATHTNDEIFQIPWDGSGEAKPLARTEDFERAAPDGWSPDGSVLAFRYNSRGGLDIWTLPAEGVAEPLLDTEFDETTPAFSPDGLWLAYESNQSGRQEVYVRSYPGPVVPS